MTLIDNNTNLIIGEDIVYHEDFDKNTITKLLRKITQRYHFNIYILIKIEKF